MLTEVLVVAAVVLLIGGLIAAVVLSERRKERDRIQGEIANERADASKTVAETQPAENLDALAERVRRRRKLRERWLRQQADRD